MSYLVLIIVVGAFFTIVEPVFSIGILTRASTLKNKHLVVAALDFLVSVKITRNDTGHIVKLEGVSPLMMEWLSHRFKFQYSILDVNATSIEDGGFNSPGALSYVLRGECDVIMATAYGTAERLRQLDFVHPWMYTFSGILIPVPQTSSNNVDAIIKPFHYWVWIGLIVTALVVLFTAWCFNKFQESKQATKNFEIRKSIFKGKIKNISMYVLGTLLNQGGYLSNKKTIIRLVVGGWCLLALVMLNTYNGILISFVTATRNYQLTIDEVITNPTINIVVDKGKAHDLIFSTAATGIFKTLGDKLRSFPDSRCKLVQECVDMVKSLPSRHVYVNGIAQLKIVIKEEYQRTKKCQMTIIGARKGFGSRPLNWVLAKKSPYLEEFNLGVLILHDAGLLNFWEQQMLQTRPCYNVEDIVSKRVNRNTKTLTRLTLENLAGAFVLLTVGVLISFLVFLIEIIIEYKYRA